jgi:signal transduction histidine kinase
MAKFSPGLFTRLYASIFFAIVVSVLLTQYSIDNLFEEEGYHDFVSDTHHMYVGLTEQLIREPLDEGQYPVADFPFADEFLVSWRVMNSTSPICQACDYAGEFNGVDVYSIGGDRLLAVYFMPSIDAQLLISDRTELLPKIPKDSLELNELEEFSIDFDIDIEIIIFYFFTLLCLLLIASVIYWPIRLLQKQMIGLVETNNMFGQGELSVRANEKLTKPLNTLAVSFNNMASSIEDSVKESQIFAQAIPHEVRTPLSRIQLASGLLRRTCSQESEQNLLENIDTYIDDIDELITQIVSFTRLNSITKDNEFDVSQTVHLYSFTQSRVNAISSAELIENETSKYLIDSANTDQSITIDVQISPELSIKTNPMYIRLLIDNLVKNALNHTSSNILISATTSINNISLIVGDDGPGVPSESFETIFFPFARLDKSRSRKTGGLGLGLAIAKAATKKMQADLSVDNDERGGAQFTCVFTLDKK